MPPFKGRRVSKASCMITLKLGGVTFLQDFSKLSFVNVP
jgi:hypothetical protein